CNEIVRYYGFGNDRIDLIRNGVRVSDFGPAPRKRAAARAQLRIGADEIAVLFLGSGWERKGLRFAVAAIEKLREQRMRLLVAGRGNERKYRTGGEPFPGEIGMVRLPLAGGDIVLFPSVHVLFSNVPLPP